MELVWPTVSCHHDRAFSEAFRFARVFSPCTSRDCGLARRTFEQRLGSPGFLKEEMQ